MAYPTTISNGDIPDADILTGWLDWFAKGRGIKKATYALIKTEALTDPTYPFMAWATDTEQLVFYTGDITIGDVGFITIGGA